MHTTSKEFVPVILPLFHSSRPVNDVILDPEYSFGWGHLPTVLRL